ncbi:MAG: metalloregulator ArsR/SmtB family transcription factor [Spirochaetia bacterium]|nr:metalloregulator ArsR/SmtB family transcription factor [Spirochaetia bacterium]
MEINESNLHKCCLFFKVLGDPTRMRIILVLKGQELCVSEICEKLNMSPSAVSHQLNVLRKARVVKSRRDGKNIYYSFDDGHVDSVINSALEHTILEPLQQLEKKATE